MRELGKAHIRTIIIYKELHINVKSVLLCCWFAFVNLILHKPLFDRHLCFVVHVNALMPAIHIGCLIFDCLTEITWTRALTTSMGLVTVEAVAAARGPAIACSTRWGQLLGAILDNCSVEPIRAKFQLLQNQLTLYQSLLRWTDCHPRLLLSMWLRNMKFKST